MASIDNNRLFIVDNSLAQNKEWEKELFRAIAPLKKKWISHTIEDDPEVLDLAAKAGAWYVYQAVYDTSDYIKERVKRYHAESDCNQWETFFVCYISELRIKFRPFFIFTVCSSSQILFCCCNNACWICGCYFNSAAFKEFEETFCMILKRIC